MEFYGQLRELAHPARFQDFLKSLYEKPWVLYVKPPFGGPEQVLRYLARYTHRVAISNGRLLGLEGGQVNFRWRDSQDHNQMKQASLDAVEFIRRFLLHVLPSGFVKIRHFGFLANRGRKKNIQRCRQLLPLFTIKPVLVPSREPLCPFCKEGHLRVIDWGSRSSALPATCYGVAVLDSS